MLIGSFAEYFCMVTPVNMLFNAGIFKVILDKLGVILYWWLCLKACQLFLIFKSIEGMISNPRNTLRFTYTHLRSGDVS